MESPLTARAAILFALSTGEAYGMEIIERVVHMTSGAVVLLQGSPYPALHDLEEEDLVSGRMVEPERGRGGRARNYWRLTEAGERRVAAWRTALTGLVDPPA